jgi:hypothetical protein
MRMSTAPDYGAASDLSAQTDTIPPPSERLPDTQRGLCSVILVIPQLLSA